MISNIKKTSAPVKDDISAPNRKLLHQSIAVWAGARAETKPLLGDVSQEKGIQQFLHCHPKTFMKTLFEEPKELFKIYSNQMIQKMALNQAGLSSTFYWSFVFLWSSIIANVRRLRWYEAVYAAKERSMRFVRTKRPLLGCYFPKRRQPTMCCWHRLPTPNWATPKTANEKPTPFRRSIRWWPNWRANPLLWQERRRKTKDKRFIISPLTSYNNHETTAFFTECF